MELRDTVRNDVVDVNIHYIIESQYDDEDTVEGIEEAFAGFIRSDKFLEAFKNYWHEDEYEYEASLVQRFEVTWSMSTGQEG